MSTLFAWSWSNLTNLSIQ